MEEKIKNSKNLVKYTDSEDLAKRTVSDKILKNEAYEIFVNPKYDGYQRELASMLYNSFDNSRATDSSNLRIQKKKCVCRV